MITILNNPSKIELLKKQGFKYIKTPYKKVNTVIAYEKGISENIKHIINSVEICEVHEGNLISKFTNTPIELDKLSDGCKTVIYVYFRAILVQNNKEIIDITGCGANAIAYILRNYSDKNLMLYLGHWEIPKNIKVAFYMNDECIKNTNELFA